MNFDNLFPDVRETGETRIRQSQLVMLRMLKIVDFLCAKYDIKYFLTGGSLLGAIRHQGFIPWDDDLDIAMTRDNYIKFVNHAVAELPSDIFFQTPETDPYYPACDYVEAKLRDKYSSYNKDKYKYHDGIQLDIFVYDRSFLPHNFFIIAQNRLLKVLKSNEKRAGVLQWIAKYSPVRLVYASSYLKDFGLLNTGTYVKKNEFSSLIRMPFEDMEVLIPSGWDSYLKRQYGDYMQLPPIEKRTTHHADLPNPFSPCHHEKILQWPPQKTEPC